MRSAFVFSGGPEDPCWIGQPDYSSFFESSGFGVLSLVNHHTTIAGPKQMATPIGMLKMLQNASIILLAGLRSALGK